MGNRGGGGRKGGGCNEGQKLNIRELLVLIDNLHSVLIVLVLFLADIRLQAHVTVDSVGSVVPVGSKPTTTTVDGHYFFEMSLESLGECWISGELDERIQDTVKELV